MSGLEIGAVLRWRAATMLVVGVVAGLAAVSPVAAIQTTFGAGSLIVPMDTGSSGQNNGMLSAYGLVYQLLRNGVPVHWAINPAKSANGDDFSVALTGVLQDVRTGATLAPRTYRGGPFLIASADAAAALPLIQAFQDSAGDATAVHRLLAGGSITVEVPRLLLAAPRIAIVKDTFEPIIFNNLNTARILDSAGGFWTASSPDLLTEAAIAGLTATTHDDGALFNGSPLRLPRYCQVISTHSVPTANTPEVVQEVRQWLDRGSLTQLYLQCESTRVFENEAAGKFLTTAGLNDDGSATSSPAQRLPATPEAQLDGVFEADNGTADSLKAVDAPGSLPDYKWGVTTLINESSAALSDRIVMLSGRLDGVVENGRVTYLAGHDYSLAVPITSNPQTNGVRLFLNSLFTADCVVTPPESDLQLTLSAPQYLSSGAIQYTLAYANLGTRPAENLKLVDSLPAGTNFVAASGGGLFIGGAVTWNLAPLAAGGAGSVTLQVNVSGDGVYSNVATLDGALLTLRHRVSNTVTTTVDREAPLIFFTPGNPTATADPTPTFGFTLGASLSPAHAECRIDADAFAPCTSPFTAPLPLADGVHQLDVLGADAAGNQGIPSNIVFVVDSVAPVAEIAGPPTNPRVTADDTPDLHFSFQPGGSPNSAECRLFAFSDPGATTFVPCTSPYTPASPLGADGAYLFEVRGTDAAGNLGGSDLFGFQLDTGRPQVVELDSVGRGNWSAPGEPEIAAAVTRILVRFDDAMATSGSTSALDAANWRLVAAGADQAVTTADCAALGGDDTVVTLTSIEHDATLPGTEQVALAIAEETGLPAGRYRLFACAALTDVAGNPLAGGTSPAGDFRFDFRISRTPRIVNPNFDAGLDGWILGGPVPAEWSHGAFDGEGQPLSGAARLETGVGIGASWHLEQCIELVELTNLGSGALAVLTRIDSGESAAPAARAYYRWNDAAACSGNVTASGTSGSLSGDSSGVWHELGLQLAPPPVGSESLLVGFGVLGGTASVYSVDFDRALAPASLELFADGFESADVCEWTTAIGAPGC